MAAVCGSLNDSPVKPKDVAMEPAEDAHDLENEKKIENTKDASKDVDEVDGDVCKQEVLITSEMISEEEELEKQGEKEEQKIKQEHDKIWRDLDAEDREHRYKRLQFLLSKSNMYTQYLLSRMEKQKTEQEKKAERIKKRQEKEEKKNLASQKASGITSATLESDNTKNSQTIGIEKSPQTQPSEEPNPKSRVNIQETSVSSDTLSSPGPRRSTRGSKPGTPNSQDSQNSQGSRKGRKRKANSAANSPNITNFFKKQKPDDSSQEEKPVDQEMKIQDNKENCPDQQISVKTETNLKQSVTENTAHSEEKKNEVI